MRVKYRSDARYARWNTIDTVTSDGAILATSVT